MCCFNFQLFKFKSDRFFFVLLFYGGSSSCFLGQKTGYDRLPYTSLAKGQFNFELRGLPDGIKFKDPSEMGGASLTAIIQHTKSHILYRKVQWRVHSTLKEVLQIIHESRENVDCGKIRCREC